MGHSRTDQVCSEHHEAQGRECFSSHTRRARSSTTRLTMHAHHSTLGYDLATVELDSSFLLYRAYIDWITYILCLRDIYFIYRKVSPPKIRHENGYPAGSVLDAQVLHWRNGVSSQSSLQARPGVPEASLALSLAVSTFAPWRQYVYDMIFKERLYGIEK